MDMDALTKILGPACLSVPSTLYYLVLGLIVISWVFGHVVVYLFRLCLKTHMKLPEDNLDPATKEFPGWLTGVLERTIFTLWVGFAGPGPAVVTGMGGWLALKLATNWNRRNVGDENDDNQATQVRIIRGAWLALMSGVVSMGFAFLGGIIIWSVCSE